MPKTRPAVARARKTPGVNKKDQLPSLEALSAKAKGDLSGDEDDDFDASNDDAEVVRTLVKSNATISKTNGKGLSEAPAPRRNLRELFSMEETIIETITLDGRTRKPLTGGKPEKMKIFLRVRPFLNSEINRHENKNLFSVLPEQKGIALNPPPSSQLYRRLAVSQGGKVAYEFTQVLGDELSQAEVFQRTMRQPIQDFLSGTSQLIFTYGVTNSGKTYTLLGPKGKEGILPRSLDRIFSALGINVNGKIRHQPDRYEDVILLDERGQKEAMIRHKEYIDHKVPKGMNVTEFGIESTPVTQSFSQTTTLERSGSGMSNASADSHGFFDHRPVSSAEDEVRTDRDCVDPDASYEVWVSFMEIYDDVAYDLLDNNNRSKTSGRVTRSRTLKICDEQNTCYAKGLIEVPVFSAAEAYHVMGIGRKNLHVATTKLNDASSRSHAIFTVKVVKVIGHLVTVTQLSFCDLAGTERAQRTENTGTRMKESQNINKDLHHLKECIEALKKSRGGKSHKELIPYRNCKLTRLFRSFFSGKGTASLILNISQCASDFDETVQAIRFGTSAMRIMIPMTKRESILIQPPQFGRMALPIHQNVVSVQMEDPLDGEPSIIEEESEEDSSDSDEDRRSAPRTVKKRPLRSSDIGNSTVVISKTNTTKDKASTVKKALLKPNASKTVTKKRTAATKSAHESASSSFENDNDEDHSSEASTSVEPESEDGELAEADLTLGGAVRADYDIPDDYWEANCPFPQHIEIQDHRIRGLLLLLGNCQREIKQSKAANMANEMKVRKELCDFYEKERKKHAKEHAQALQKLREECSADIQNQLAYQKEAMERMFQSRGDPSLMSFENHETDIEKQELREENDRLAKALAEKIKELKEQRDLKDF